MSSGLDGDSPLLAGTVSMAHILAAAGQLEESPEATYSRIKKYEALCGLELPHIDAEQLNKLAWSENYRLAMSSGLDGDSPWLAGTISAAHILAAARSLHESPEATYTRIKKYESLCGLKLPHIDTEQLSQLAWSKNDRIALSQDLSGESPFLEFIDAQHVTYAAWYIGESEEKIRERLRRFAVLGVRTTEQ